MKVRVRKGRTLHTDGAMHEAGAVLDLPAAVARDYIEDGVVESADDKQAAKAK